MGLGEEILNVFFNETDPQGRIYRKSSLDKMELKMTSP